MPGEKVVYTALQSPVPFNMVINLEAQPDETTMSTAELQLQLPFFMRKLVESQLQDGANRFGELLALIPFDRLGFGGVKDLKSLNIYKVLRNRLLLRFFVLSLSGFMNFKN